jgi:hypothetical protein
MARDGVAGVDHEEHEQIYPQSGADILICRRFVWLRVKLRLPLALPYAAGLALGYFMNLDDLSSNWAIHHIWKPKINGG